MPLSLIPDRVFQDYQEVTPQLLGQLGVGLLLCDLDYTLAPKSQRYPDDALRGWLKAHCDSGITVVILSNNRSDRRVQEFCGQLGISYVGHADKPSRKGFRQAMEQNGFSPEHTAMLGDKLLTDVLGAKRVGIPALMVEPLGGPVGHWNHVLHVLQRPFKAIAKRRMKR